MKYTAIILAVALMAASVGMIATIPETAMAAPSLNEFRVNGNAELALEADGGTGTAEDPWIIENRNVDGTGLNYAVFIGNTTEHLIIRNSTINGTTEVHSFWFHVSAGIHLYNADYVTITNCTVNNTMTYGIYASNYSTNIQIDNCTTWQNGDRGISYSAVTGSVIQDNYIYGNDTTTHGIVIDLISDNHLITRNTIQNTTYSGIACNDTWNTTITYNEIDGEIADMGPDGNQTTAYGILIYNSRYIDCASNEVTDCAHGIVVSGTPGTTTRDSDFRSNILTGCYDVGILVNTTTNVTFTLNELNNTNGVVDDYGVDNTGIMTVDNVEYTNFTYNTIRNYDVGINVTDDTGVLESYFYHNTLASNTLHAWAETTDAMFQFWDEITDMGNWWDDWTYVHGGDADRDGIVDTPRDIAGTGASIDSYPQTTVPALETGGGGGYLPPAEEEPIVDTAPETDGWDFSLGWMFWLGGAFVIIGFAMIPIPYTQPIWFKVGGAFLILLNFIL